MIDLFINFILRGKIAQTDYLYNNLLPKKKMNKAWKIN